MLKFFTLAAALLISLAAIGCANKERQSMKSSSNNAQPISMTQMTCPMHPEVTSNKAGKCPKCGLALVPADSTHAGHAP